MYKNNLFNENEMSKLIKSYFKDFNKDNYISPISEWLEMLKKGELVDEESNYKNFYGIILKDLLEYELNDYGTQVVIEKGRKADVVLKKNEEYYAIIELKGTKTEDLNRRYDRPMSAVEQVINYTSVKEESKWAIVSNYDEFRLFNPNSSEKYISFNFEDLTEEENLKKFLLVFSKLTLIENRVLEKLLEKSKILEKNLEDKFYVLFGVTRSMLIKELESSFKDMSRDKAIKLAQLILNRYIFICFAEDLELIPQTTKKTILGPVKSDLIFENNIWHNIISLFRMMNVGNKVNKIHSFNGGLFKEDISKFNLSDCKDSSFFSDCFEDWKFVENYEDINKELGDYKDIINPIYKNLLLISAYNFKSDVSVNILGHILENSIGDIEILKNEKEFKRKKEGVYYTPEYITDYICKNTIIPYLSLSGNCNNTHDLIEEYKEINDLDSLDFKLKNIKIIDPACGSGAFLNKAVDVLYEIHKELYDSKYADDVLDKYVFDSLKERRQIIRNNIFGVDLNEESVEITKLSLFLKLATNSEMEDGLKLPNLDKNIKCGNSLIDNKEIVGEKAFKWEDKFKDIFDDGGFDVVVGNPPYVRQESILKVEKDFLSQTFETCSDSTNLYVPFFERGLKILKNGGYFSFICSNKFITVDYGKNLRKFLLNYRIHIINDYADENIFPDAAVDTCIIVIENTCDEYNKIHIDEKFVLPQNLLNENLWFLSNPYELILKEKLLNKGILLGDIPSITINNGIKTGCNKAFYIDKETKDNLINQDFHNEDIIKPLLIGKNIGRYQINFEEQYLIFSMQGISIDKYPSIKEHLYDFIEDLTPKKSKSDKKGRKPGDYKWYEIQDKTEFYENFEKPKLIWAEMNKEISFCYDENKYFVNNKCFFITSDEIDLKFLNGLFLSKLFRFIFKSITSSLGKNTVELRKSYLKNAPIIFSKEYENSISSSVSSILYNNELINKEVNSFQNWLKRKFDMDVLSKKLEKYYELDFEEFLKELKKKKIDISKRKTQDLLENEFNESLKIIKPLQRQIVETDTKINQLVYKLYDLTDEEIMIIENSLSE